MSENIENKKENKQDKKEVSLQELYALRQRDIQIVEEIRSIIASYSQAVRESLIAKETLEQISKSKGKVKLRLGANLFIDAEVKNKDVVFENVAGEFLKETTKEDALITLNKNLEVLNSKISDLRKQESNLLKKIAEYDQAFKSLYQAQQKLAEQVQKKK